jgi:hypothetical protein
MARKLRKRKSKAENFLENKTLGGPGRTAGNLQKYARIEFSVGA